MIDESAAIATFHLGLPVTIRHAAADDLPRLEWDPQTWGFRGIFRKTYRETLLGERLMLLADVGGYPVGRLFVQLSVGNLTYADGVTRGYLYSLHVMPPFQGHGIGTRLIQTAEAMLIERRYQFATIAVAQTNQRARHLYERLGYRIFRQEESHWFYADPNGRQHEVKETCWAMKKRLADPGLPLQWAADI